MVEAWIINSFAYLGGACLPVAKGYWKAWSKDAAPWDWRKFGVSMAAPILFYGLPALVILANLDDGTFTNLNVVGAFGAGITIKVLQEFVPVKGK